MATTSLRHVVIVCASASFELSVNSNQEVRCVFLQSQRDPLDAKIEDVITGESDRTDEKARATGDHFLVQTTSDDSDTDVVRCRDIVEDADNTRDRSNESEHWRNTGDHTQVAQVLLHTTNLYFGIRLHHSFHLAIRLSHERQGGIDHFAGG